MSTHRRFNPADHDLRSGPRGEQMQKTGDMENNVELSVKPRTPLKQLFSCGVGNFYNDLIRQTTSSFGLLFYMRVAGLSNSQAGFVFVAGQIGSFVSCVLFGYCCDKISVPLLSRRVGRRKSWHLVALVFLVFGFVSAFGRCAICTESTSNWVAFAYFLFTYTVLYFFYGAAEVSHYSIFPDVAKNEQEAVTLSIFRTGFSYIAGILSCVTALVVLGQSRQGDLSANNWKEFMIITVTLTAVGIVCASLFHTITKESKVKKSQRRASVVCSLAGLYNVKVIFGLGESPGTTEVSDNDNQRKTSSVIRKLSAHLVPFEIHERELQKDVRPKSDDPVLALEVREPEAQSYQLSDSRATEGNSLLDVDQDRRVSRERKFSVWHLPTYVKKNPVVDSSEGDIVTISKTEEENVEIMHKQDRKDDQTIQRDSFAFDSIVVMEEEVEGSLKTSDNITEAPEANKLSRIINASHTEVREVETPKGTVAWLKDPSLYKVTFITVFARLFENMAYSYMALYILDHLHFSKEAIAYFPLVYLLGGLCGTAVSKKLNLIIGKKLTYTLSAGLGIGSAVWFYYVTPSTRQMVYAPIVLSGCSASAMYVMALSLITDAVRKNKESSGFVFSFATINQKALCAVLYVIIQAFYPEDRDNCEDCGNYIRTVYALSLGSLSLAGMLVVLIFHRSSPPDSAAKE